jgi:hypothetical protein
MDDGNGVLTGSIEIADQASGSTGAAVKQATFAFTGILSDSGQVTLKVKQDLGPVQTWNGTLDDDELTVDVPQGLNSVDTIRLAKGTAEDYKVEVAALEAAVNKARGDASLSAESDQEAAVARDADAAARRAFEDAVDDVSSAQEAVLAFLLAPAQLRALGKDVAAARSKLAAVREPADEAVQRGNGFVACEFAQRARDAAQVLTDDKTLARHARAVAQAADDLADGRAALSQAYATLLRLTDGGGQSSKSGSLALESLVDKARATALDWRLEARRARKSRAAIIAQADQLVEQAFAASC